MKKIYQKEFYQKRISNGDCLKACLLTITGLTNLSVFTKIGPYINILKNSGWLLETDFVLDDLEFRKNTEEYYIAIGDGGRNTNHATIVNKLGELIHDPFPGGNGNISCQEILILSRIDN